MADKVDLDEFRQELFNYYKANNRLNCRDIRVSNGFKFNEWIYRDAVKEQLDIDLGHYMRKVLNITRSKYDKSKYYDYLNELISYLPEANLTSQKMNQISKEQGLPCSTWFIDHCPCKEVKTYSEFLEWSGLSSRSSSSKESATKIIYAMQDKLNRPLMYDDFRNPKGDEIGIRVVSRHWGTLNKMKKELGLEIVQESMMDKKINIDIAKNDIKELCSDLMLKEDRYLITTTDIDTQAPCSYGTYARYFINEGTTIREYIESIGYRLNESGVGLRYTFEDGEEIYSQYEHQFSSYLRDSGLVFNEDYYRDVKYNTFIPNYKDNMNCDYLIYFNDTKIYVEVVGFLRDYKDWYYDNRVIGVSSKDKYRLHLYKKEKMLKENHLRYYILFPKSHKDGGNEYLDIPKNILR